MSGVKLEPFFQDEEYQVSEVLSFVVYNNSVVNAVMYKRPRYIDFCSSALVNGPLKRIFKDSSYCLSKFLRDI